VEPDHFTINCVISSNLVATPLALRTPPPFSNNQVTAVDPGWKPPQTYMWSFGVQRELPKKIVWELDYLGRKGIHLYGAYDANQAKIRSNGRTWAAGRRRLGAVLLERRGQFRNPAGDQVAVVRAAVRAAVAKPRRAIGIGTTTAGYRLHELVDKWTVSPCSDRIECAQKARLTVEQDGRAALSSDFRQGQLSIRYTF
jgi:hypothetical protein